DGSPRDARAAAKHEGRVSLPLADETFLPGTSFLALRPASPRVEPRAPATAEPHSAVLLGQARKGIPGRGVERLDLVVAHRTSGTGSWKTASTLLPSGSSANAA